MATLRPLFPDTLLPGYPLQCPKVQSPSSPLRAKFWFYVHEKILKPISNFYVRYYGINCRMGIFPLPFGLFLKSHDQIREQEAMAMNLARAMGIPAPIAPSYGSVGTDDNIFTLPSILMTRVPGKDISQYPKGAINLDIVKEDLIKIIVRMRSFGSPWGDAVCGVDGGMVSGLYIPDYLISGGANESAFYQNFRDVAMFTATHHTEKHKGYIAGAERLFSLPPHAIVFTHGDMQWHNILVTPDSHITGIVDWESAGWMPDYWEFTIPSLRRSFWEKFMTQDVARNVYQEEVTGHRFLFEAVGDFLYH
ncbi:hypothetical protein NLI96_g6308 [Meripilus lineatus]|uniref:Aminoglycoside phosphotransferase domain-containing protein n=1 Tax=Meripilus lineatus TaxID=2056292 RepID=A0AAD5V1V1_9APHY|nr:hypothetical protein NLI96_g6308 [Physisporinus lineatus]